MTTRRLDPQTGLFLTKSIGVSETDARQARREVETTAGPRVFGAGC